MPEKIELKLNKFQARIIDAIISEHLEICKIFSSKEDYTRILKHIKPIRRRLFDFYKSKLKH